MAKKIVILEDNADRRAAMARCLDDRFYQFERQFFDRSEALIDYLRVNLGETILISLDHDLEICPARDGKLVDFGTGREVADFLAERSPICPVILHSTNSAAVVGMENVLQEGGWETHRVVPFDDLEWIPTDWFRTVRQAIVRPAKSESGRLQSDR